MNFTLNLLSSIRPTVPPSLPSVRQAQLEHLPREHGRINRQSLPPGNHKGLQLC